MMNETHIRLALELKAELDRRHAELAAIACCLPNEVTADELLTLVRESWRSSNERARVAEAKIGELREELRAARLSEEP